MLFKAENIQKNYNGHRILSDASFEINEGEIVGIYGPSGSGKSTIAKIICGAVRPDGGSFTELGLSVQMIYQQPWSSLDPSQKIGNGFEELIKYHQFAKTDSEVKSLTEKQLEEVGLDVSILGHLPHQISGGEAQRVAIAKALLFDPKLLVMDEATSMLDVLTQASIIDLIKRVITDRGGSVLLISHDLELVKFVCSRVYLLEDMCLIPMDYHYQKGLGTPV